MKSRIYWGAIRTGNNSGPEYVYPMTEHQKRKITIEKINVFLYGLAVGGFWGVVLGYAWRMAQG